MPSIVGELTKGATFNKLVDRTNVMANITSKTAVYTATTTDDVILCDASGGAFIITLYTAVGNNGRMISIVKTDLSANSVTVDGNASETINGTTTKVLNKQYSSMRIVSDNSGWVVV